MRDRGGEEVWRYTLRIRLGLFGSWRMLTEHRAGTHPYLAEIGTFSVGRSGKTRFSPTNGVLPRGAYSIPSRNKATIAPTKINKSALAMGLNGGFNFPEIALNGKSPFDLIKNVRALAVRHFCSHKFTCR